MFVTDQRVFSLNDIVLRRNNENSHIFRANKLTKIASRTHQRTTCAACCAPTVREHFFTVLHE